MKWAFGGEENSIDKKAVVQVSCTLAGVMNVKDGSGTVERLYILTLDSGGRLIIQRGAQPWETKVISCINSSNQWWWGCFTTWENSALLEKRFRNRIGGYHLLQLTLLGRSQSFWFNTKESMGMVAVFMAYEGMSLTSFSETLLFQALVVEHMLGWIVSHHSLCIPLT